MEHLIIEVMEKFIKVTCSEGHFITNWDKVNILEYTCAKTMYTPLNADLSTYYCLTDEEHAEYEKKQMEAIIELERLNKETTPTIASAITASATTEIISGTTI